jgi:hypothetical protein
MDLAHQDHPRNSINLTRHGCAGAVIDVTEAACGSLQSKRSELPNRDGAIQLLFILREDISRPARNLLEIVWVTKVSNRLASPRLLME